MSAKAILSRLLRNRPFASPGRPPVSADELSHGQLIRRRFREHRLAVFALHLLIVLYLIVGFCEFVAPYPANWRDLDYIYAPPQLPRFSLARGFYTDALEPAHDPITLRHHYRVGPGYVPLGFFVEGEPYELWGAFRLRRRLFGVDDSRLAQAGAAGIGVARAEATVAPAPRFYFLGADRYGRDIFSRIVYGARVSLSIGLLAVVISVVLGVVIGGISGYVGGYLDEAIQRLIEIIGSFPQIPLWLALGVLIPADWPQVGVYLGITVVLSLLGWTGLARAVRGKIMALREEDYAVAAKLLGAGHGRILFRHLVPGFASHILVSLSLSVPGMILGETSLSFLGLGLRPPVVSWGVMLQDCMHMQTVAHYPWLLTPVLFIVLAVLVFNYVGDGIRDAADPYSTR